MRLLIAGLALVGLVGCSTYAVPRYSVSAETVATIRAIGDIDVDVGEFGSEAATAPRAAGSEIMCRGVGPITTPDGETFAEYIRNALISELILADVYQKGAPVTLRGTIDALDFSSNTGKWDVAMTLASSNGQSLSVAESYEYKTSFYGETACNQTAQAGLGAIQNLIRAAVSSPDFGKLLTP